MVEQSAILMDDNARPNGAREVQDFLQSQSIKYMHWPARSLDLNPIEHMRNELQVRI